MSVQMPRYGAVIVAAGKSTRMKEFKQMMQIDHMAIAERVVKKFLHAGVQDVVMITGYRADEIEKALKKLGIVFLRNEKYETTQMLDSAKIGLRYMEGHCDRIYFCPVDVPFFSENTIRLEMTRKENLVFPICRNRIGHPILFDAALIPDILEYQGPRGLKGALDSFSAQTTCFLPVSDEGAVMSADTPRDAEYLKKLENDQKIHVESSISIALEKPFFNRDTVTLLRQIDRLGSVHEASDRTGISYSKAWQLIRDAEKGFGRQLVERSAGGKSGGEAHLTKDGCDLVFLYGELEFRVQRYAQQEYCNIFDTEKPFSKNVTKAKI